MKIKYILPFCMALVWAAEPTQFSHFDHVKEEEMACTDCHEKINESKDIQTILPLDFKVCADCHEDTTFSRSNFNSKIPVLDQRKMLTEAIWFFLMKNTLKKSGLYRMSR